jgi:hypothetical protein
LVVIDDQVNVVLNVALRDQSRSINVVQISGTDLIVIAVGKQVTFERVRPRQAVVFVAININLGIPGSSCRYSSR